MIRLSQYKYLLTTLLSILAYFVCYGQKNTAKKAELDFDNKAYINAIKVYERIANKGYINTSILTNLGDSYYFNGKLESAYTWYNQLLNGQYEDKNIAAVSSEYYYRYAQCLKALKKYKEADEILEIFSKLELTDSRARLFDSQKDTYLTEIKNEPNRFDLKKLSFNTPYSDYGATIINSNLIYTSARATGITHSKIHQWTKESFTSLYQIEIYPDWTFGEPTLFAKNIDANGINDASAVFTKDGKTMYFTKNNSSEKGKGIFNKNDNSLLKIYKATLNSHGEWANVQALPFNADTFSCAHPALTPDDKWLYFASDRDGTYGSSDIFRVELRDFNTYGIVENLGSRINTEGRETFPFISDNNILYFSTDGHPGLGGLDVFMAEIYKDGTFGKVTNVGSPVNSSFDDFAFYYSAELKKGFVSSNRTDGHGGDDVYLLVEKPCLQTLSGTIIDYHDRIKVAGVIVTLYDSNYNEIKNTKSSYESGGFEFYDLKCNEKYRVKVEIEGYNTIEVPYIAENQPGSQTLLIEIEKVLTPVTIEDDLFKKLKLKPIYFDFDKSDIRREATIELIKIVEVMKDVENMKIEIRSHTDNRGNATYNLRLSNARATATANWIIDQGIDSSRITHVGLGALSPEVNCLNPTDCTEEEHQQNRRSEFIILEL